MSSTTKKTLIDKKSQEYIDSLQTTSQMYRALSDYERAVKEENDHKKKMFAKEVANMGEVYMEEIDTKHEEIENERLDMIDFIIETTEEKLVKVRILRKMSHEEVKSIYLKAQDSNKPWYRLLIEFFMGW